MDSTSTPRSRYEIVGRPFLTPALAIYPDLVESNISNMLKLLGSPNRWRPHIKTIKLAFAVRHLIERGVANLKCATTLELLTACAAGARDVLIAYPLLGVAAERVAEIAAQFPAVQISGLVENVAGVEWWNGKRVGLFLDLNPGMNRTGVEAGRVDEIVKIARAVLDAGVPFRGVHYYEGHHTEDDLQTRIANSHRGYAKLLEVISALEASGISVEEVVTSGTPALPCAVSYEGLRRARFLHRVSSGTLIYGDLTSMQQLPTEYGFQVAASVVATVVSKPTRGLITCDAGHKSISADAGIPTCLVDGEPELRPLSPSEEHLPIEVPDGVRSPNIGDRLYLIPRHICPTVNNFDTALIVIDGTVRAIERVTARGHEEPSFDLRSEEQAEPRCLSLDFFRGCK